MRCRALCGLALLALAGCGDRVEPGAVVAVEPGCRAPALAGSPTAEAPWYGVHATLRISEAPDRAAGAAMACELRVQLVREDLEWRVVQPTKEARFDFGRFDAVVRAAAQRGLTVLPILDGVPAWGGPDPQGSPSDVPAYARFAAAAVRRYGPHGSFWREEPDLPARPSTWWEHMNEVYLHDPDPRRCARAVIAGTDAMRAADPNVRVLVGAETEWTFDGQPQSDWLGRLYAADPRFRASFDAASVHPYSWPDGPDSRGEDGRGGSKRLERIRRTLLAHGDAEKHLWVTEIGWPTCRGNERCVSRQEQATFLTRFVALRDTRWRGYVDAVILYQLRDGDSDSSDPEKGFGVLDDQGRQKPAWAAFRALAARAQARLPAP